MSETMAYTTRQSLLKAVHEQDETAWRAFVDFYMPLILMRAKDFKLRPDEVDELRQEVFLAVSQYDLAGRYDPARGRFRDYLRRVITNCALHILRARADFTAEALPEKVKAEATPPDKAQEEEEWRQFILQKALEELKSKCEDTVFMAFDMYALRGLPVREVAAALKTSEEQVYQAKSRLAGRLQAIVARLTRELDE